ncbi:MAG TPA: GlsB/YeaQ/YmgE family stress response membrane protein [Anaerolineae bacterium]|nr:GlsB/YeaQ/YmgE family stress response membrane protein [Anaerolineae bacterium]
MNFIIWLIVGGIVGWLASIVMRTDGQQGLILNIVVGIAGAFVAGLVLTPMLGISTINQSNFSLPGLLISLMGAIVLLAIVGFFQKGRFGRR